MTELEQSLSGAYLRNIKKALDYTNDNDKTLL